MTTPFLELVGITKTYPGVVALDGVSLSVAPGEVIALIGENGAGKSTLMKVLGGVVSPTAGHIRVDGAERASFSVADAIGAGIAFVHQELNLFENLDVAANVFIGREPVRGPLRLIDRRKLRADVEPLLKRLKVDFGPDTQVFEMSLAQRQLLEIVKALSLNSRLVIMDEPTSSLTLTETDRLMRVIAGLKADGVSVIFISHRLNEVQICADRCVVLRDGRVVGELAKSELTHERMTRLMIGRDLKSLYVPPAAPPGDSALDIVEARTATYPAHSVSLSVRRGEILGLAGLVGSGRSELARAVFGIDRLLGGSIRLGRRADPGRHAARGDRPWHLPRAGGQKRLWPAARFRHHRQCLAAGPRELCQRIAGERAPRARQRRGAETPAEHPRAERVDDRRLAFRRQPAEGGAGEMAVDDAARHDLRRADARRRRRRQEGDL